ncbi:hypothetical protein GUJ93_ZPchr0002g26395 [Zizania palustris]|uniref:Uncharacterized protein n=1 Tax=Zizania palustris TaxID=103762 RepID=A0A8J5VW44_ZIZPA|nr:hypothetical protein GUJ93_ZPchr0002g26395 [Zizania palustris]
MGRAPCCDKASVKKGPWSPEEDAKLKAYIEENGTGGNWIALPQKIGLKRCGKSCRLRWLNYLRPNIKHGDFTEEEEHIICSLYISIGSRWSIIAAQLPGRTDNDIKNYWNTKLKKKLLGKRGPSRRGRANQEPAACGTLAATEGGATAAAQALSSSALERIQLHMRLQGLYSAFSCASISSNAPPQWPKLETTLLPNRPLPAVQPTDAVATAVRVQHHPQHLVDQTLAAAAAAAATTTSEAFEAEPVLDPAAGANYMPGGRLDQIAKLGFCSSSTEAGGVAGTVESSSSSSLLGWFGYGPHDELYDFLYSSSRCDQSAGGAQGGIVHHLPELQCPDVGAVVGADEKFSAWTTASCDYGPAGQLQGNPVNMQDYVLGYDQ